MVSGSRTAVATSADDYLGSLQGEARIDSSGAFSLDLERSRDKLQRFQLPSAHHYVLPLVACAVARGADSFAYFCDERRRIVDLGGVAVELVDPYLQLALATAGRLSDTDVYGENWDGRTGLRFRVVQGQLRVLPLEIGGPTRTRLVLTSMHPWVNRLAGAVRWLAGVGPASEPAAELLKAYARYCPLPVRLNGRQLNLERQGHWKWLGVLNRPPLQLRPLTALRQTAHSHEVPFAGYLGLGVGGGGALVIVDGLLYPLEIPELGPEFRAILWHPGLQRDLSLLKLVENGGLHIFRRQLKQIFAEMAAGR